ncbi:MAG: DUF3800 domain-containing protein [Nitrospirae bacterium]|nr:DUF3800 domain-containing protein [Nitrospirota bacterium]MCL5422722.1 DUF3800 domain-containing protein [Nitrospirota bacterium]
MKDLSFRVYVDESGDEGFVFHPDGSGSSRWLVLAAAVIRKKNDLSLVRTLEDVRALLGKAPRKELHFRDLKHEQRVPYIKHVASAPIKTVSVLIHKPSMRDPEKFQSEKFLLYRYASRFLLERVSWLCRDKHNPGEGNGKADIVFSNRSIMSYQELTGYLQTLKTKSDPLDVRIDWNVIDPERVSAVDHSRLAGLQIADAVASSFFFAVNVNRYGEVEGKYSRFLLPTCYRHRGVALGYGLKFWPEDFQKLKSTNSHIAMFADEVNL